MTKLVGPAWLALYVLVASAVAVHLRGKVRLRFGRQLTDFSTFLAPFNLVFYAFSAVPKGPMLNAAAFPELTWMQSNWEAIRDEAGSLCAGGLMRASPHHDDMIGNAFIRHGWTRFYLKWYGAPLPSARRHCPRTVEVLERMPNLHAAMFSVVPPRGRLGKHRDAFAGSLRYHLGLVTPNSDRCRIYVDGEAYSWRDGEGVLFDETFVHWVENETDETRIILFCDFERPLRTRLARAFNHFMIRHVGPLTASANTPDDPIGAANRFVAAVYPAHQASRRLKARRRRLYYGLKYCSLALALGLLLYAL